MKFSLLLRFTLYFILPLILASGCSCGGGNSSDDDSDDAAGDDASDDSADDDTDDDADDDEDDDTLPDDDSSDDDSATDDDSTSDDDTAVDDDTSADDDTTACDQTAHDAFIIQGKTALGVGDHAAGYDAFAEALDICPDSADAEMGILLSDTLWYVSWIKAWTDLSGWVPPFIAEEDAASNDEVKTDGSVLQKILRYSFLPVNQEMYRLADDLLTNHPDVRFVVPSLPAWVDHGITLLDLGGEWDIADVWNLRAFVGAFEGIERIIISFDLDYDWASLINLDPPPGATPEELVHFYCGFILSTFVNPDYPDFLTLLAGGGEDISNSGTAYGMALLDFSSAFRAVKAETDPQEDDVLGYVDQNLNGLWDDGEPFRVPDFGELPEAENELLLSLFSLADNLGLAFLDTGPDDPYPLWPNWFDIAGLNPLLIYFQLIDPAQPLPHLPIPVGTWFYNPTPTGFRDAAQMLAQLLYDATTPP